MIADLYGTPQGPDWDGHAFHGFVVLFIAFVFFLSQTLPFTAWQGAVQ